MDGVERTHHYYLPSAPLSLFPPPPLTPTDGLDEGAGLGFPLSGDLLEAGLHKRPAPEPASSSAAAPVPATPTTLISGLPVIRDRMHIAALLEEVSTRVANAEMAARARSRGAVDWSREVATPIPVALLVCGPGAMVDAVFEAVRRINGGENPHRAEFHVHRETFDL